MTQALLVREDCLLVIVDVQERLIPVIANKEKVINNIVKLLKFSHTIGLPIILTEQQKLGSTVPEIGDVVAGLYPITKIEFDCFLNDDFTELVRCTGKKTLLLTGVETHICIAQTALHALPDFNVHVVSDAVSSRTIEDWHIGLERIRQNGGIITSTEMVIFELLQRAGTNEFKIALELVK